eukprot:3372661-Prymnesium_polylepis.2
MRHRCHARRGPHAVQPLDEVAQPHAVQPLELHVGVLAFLAQLLARLRPSTSGGKHPRDLHS